MLCARQPSLCPHWGTSFLALCLLAGCAGSAGPGEASWPPVGKQWYDRANASFRAGDMDDARTAIDNALKVMPDREEARVLSAKIALADLEYDHALSAVRGLDSREAESVRGRAYWYSGDLEHAADELDKLLADPDTRDPWAAEIAKLARLGVGRKPFDTSGGILAVTEMPQAGTPSMIVPLELNGEPALGLVATGTAEAMIDSSAGAKPSWVSLRFGGHFEVRDVPALATDLSALSRQVNAPIKILLGVNLLRHLHPTFDFFGGQFIVRSFDPPPPPVATTVKVSYVRGGGMLMRGAFGADASAPACALLIDTSRIYPVELDLAGWKKAGVSPASLHPVPGANELREGVLPALRIGAFPLSGVQGLQNEQAVSGGRDSLGVDVDGVIGAGLLSRFRITLVDGGRTMWLEDLPPDAFKATPLPAVEESPDLGDEAAPEEEPAPSEKGRKPATSNGAQKPTTGAKSSAAAAVARPPTNAAPKGNAPATGVAP